MLTLSKAEFGYSMSLFKRLKDIVRSNINYKEESFEGNTDIDINSYEDMYFDDSKEIPNENNTQERQYYKILEVEYGADFDEIKKAYKRLLKKYHPDLFVNQPEKLEVAQKVSAKINEAYTYFERKYL